MDTENVILNLILIDYSKAGSRPLFNFRAQFIITKKLHPQAKMFIQQPQKDKKRMVFK
jgi:hypothetical protein